VLYVDSCALLKQYIRESGSDIVAARIGEESARNAGIFMSVIGYAEVLAVFARGLRENLLSEEQFNSVQEAFLDDWLFSITLVELNVGVLGFILDLVKRHPLKGSDAIHLASALSLRDALRLGKRSGSVSESLTFVTSGKQLKRAAIAMGLDVLDPKGPNSGP
jgi:predicted nucleic acid-binding protein